MTDFLPVSKDDMLSRGWYSYDFLVVTGDAYVDHPSFGPVVIARVLEDMGFRVVLLAQPKWSDASAFEAMGRPRYGVFIGAGNLDSMVAHYTAAKKPRSEDFYSPGKKPGMRPDRATIVYSNRAREAFGSDMPIIIGGLEASLRRFSHYDYWDDKVRRSILFDSKADLLVYGMGEYATREIAKRLKRKTKPSEIRDIRGTAFIAADESACVFDKIILPSFEEMASDKIAYANAARIEYEEHDPIRGKALCQPCQGRMLIVNPPAFPLTTDELDAVFELPYTREVHPMYDAEGGVPAIEEVRFSVIHNRGCFGACNFCALAFHQGRIVTSRSHASVMREVEAMTHHPLWKGYVSDIGGPTANFRHPSCELQKKNGMCAKKRCLAPVPCKNLDADHSDYLALLRKLREIPGVKKVFVRSGIRFDYMLEDKDGQFFSELVRHHISGQLKVAPEHCVNSVLDYMGKPHIEVYERFIEKYSRLNQRFSKEQYVVPYLMSSHPGCTLNDAVRLAEYLQSRGRQPEQVQDFYPTPGTISACMYHTEIDPRTMKPVYVAKTPHEKELQRALLQWKRPEKRRLVIEALKKADREDLIGYGKNCLVRPDKSSKVKDNPVLLPSTVNVSGRAKGMGGKKAVFADLVSQNPKTLKNNSNIPEKVTKVSKNTPKSKKKGKK
ncbi:MAG: YgiQ family radical SAM protein [Clostridiales bacterium]|nr:YgiQ family radical SAM protein [Clostridiales bacterium]